MADDQGSMYSKCTSDNKWNLAPALTHSSQSTYWVTALHRPQGLSVSSAYGDLRQWPWWPTMENAQRFHFSSGFLSRKTDISTYYGGKIESCRRGMGISRRKQSQRSVTHNSMTHRVRFREILDVHTTKLRKTNGTRRHMVYLKMGKEWQIHLVCITWFCGSTVRTKSFSEVNHQKAMVIKGWGKTHFM